MMRTLTLLLVVASILVGSPLGAQDTFEMVPLAPGVWAALVVPSPPAPAFANSLVVVGDDGVLVVDTQQSPAAARALIAEVSKLTDAPVRWVVNTHWHADHVAGNAAYRAAFPGVEIIGHATLADDVAGRGEQWRRDQLDRLPEVIEERRRTLREQRTPNGQPLGEEDAAAVARSIEVLAPYLDELRALEMVAPTRTFGDRHEVRVGTRVVRLLHLGPAHTAGDVVVQVPDAGVLALGDLLEQGVPYLDHANVTGWAAALDSIEGIGTSVHVPAHGAPSRDGILLQDYRLLFHAMASRTGGSRCLGEPPPPGVRPIPELAARFEEEHGIEGARLEAAVRSAIERAPPIDAEGACPNRNPDEPRDARYE